MMTITNEDNMVLMARYPDKYFELAIVDPPYGINRGGQTETFTKDPKHKRKAHKQKDWDNEIPTAEYFRELERVSKNQIIWGANYFPLPPSQGFLIWDKKQPEDFSLAMCEFAWCSIQSPAKMFRYSVLTERDKIHPTQKPSQLYKWILDRYAKQGDKILDTHLGSGSIALACHDYGYDLTACELDKDYFDAAMKRINNHVAQQKLF